MTAFRLELDGICKRYPAVVANDHVSLRVKPGEIHAVLGENGAGKSTLMKIIYGAVKPDGGTLRFNGQTEHIANPQEARRLGISMVFQHFSLFDTLSVAENVWLGLDKSLSLAQVTQRIHETASLYGLDIDPMRPVHTLAVGEMQRVEIIRALLTNPQLLILDEPTSVLTPQAVERLFVVLRQLASEGRSILYISHKLHEIRALCNACTVMRAGRVTGECDPREETNASLSQMMIGSLPPELKVREHQPGSAVLTVTDLHLSSDEPFGVDLHGVNFQVHAGEVVGIAGVSGNGQRELLFALSGEDTRASSSSILLNDEAAGDWGAEKRRRNGLHFVPEERLGRGAVPSLSLAQNLLLTRDEAVAKEGWLRHLGWLNLHQLQQQAKHIIDRYQVKAGGPDAVARSLSGGNLQKFIVGREIEAAPKLLIVSQPTWGVDVGASAQIRAALLALRDAGCAVLVVSEELDELLELSDVLYVIANGKLSPPLKREEAEVSRIGAWMSGLWQQDAPEVSHVAS
jgi:general nucleoside transport system ATP-binding protein